MLTAKDGDLDEAEGDRELDRADPGYPSP